MAISEMKGSYSGADIQVLEGLEAVRVFCSAPWSVSSAQKPAPAASPGKIAFIQPANYEQHLELLRDCDLVIEAIAERTDESPRRVRARIEKEGLADAIASDLLERHWVRVHRRENTPKGDGWQGWEIHRDAPMGRLYKSKIWLPGSAFR